MYQQRLDQVLRQLSENGLSQMIISDPSAIFYLTGRQVDPWERLLALYLNTSGKHFFFCSEVFWFAEEIGMPKIWFSDTEDVILRLSEKIDPTAPLGVDKNFPARFLLRLMALVPKAPCCNASHCVDLPRARKDLDEQEKMREASRLNDACMERLAQALTEGMTELDAAEVVRQGYHTLGADCKFAPIIGFGANASDPHHDPDSTRLKLGDCVLADIGCQKDGYCSDMTRTLSFGQPSEMHRTIYNIVRQANETAEAAIRPGISFCALDKIARDLIAAAGYGKQFTHRLGHSIGIEAHEVGDVSSTNTDLLAPGMVFSIEPGIYLPGVTGVRIEDLVLVTETGCEILNHFPKTQQIYNADLSK